MGTTVTGSIQQFFTETGIADAAFRFPLKISQNKETAHAAPSPLIKIYRFFHLYFRITYYPSHGEKHDQDSLFTAIKVMTNTQTHTLKRKCKRCATLITTKQAIPTNSFNNSI